MAGLIFKNRRVIWLVVTGCVVTVAALGVRAALWYRAQRYLRAALVIAEEHSVMRRQVNWPVLRAQALDRARDALTARQTYDAIRFALSSLGDHHSGLIEPEMVAQLSRLTMADNPAPKGEIVSGRIGYVLVPPFVGIDQEAVDSAASRLHRVVMEDSLGYPCGWIVDLRNNIGGNMWPMLAGLGPIIGPGTVGAFIGMDGTDVLWSYENGAAWEGTRARARAAEAPVPLPMLESLPVAVLVNRTTASSGEAIAIAFQGRPHTRTFGEHTRGQTTSNNQFPLSDGAMLNLSVSWFADRLGRSYPRGVEPDEAIVGGDAASARRTAQNWVTTQAPCN
jgi:C-terminal processing protease CtpA/Prc